jgi:hypothetical protein
MAENEHAAAARRRYRISCSSPTAAAAAARARTTSHGVTILTTARIEPEAARTTATGTTSAAL